MILRNKCLLFILFLCPLCLAGQYSNVIHYTVNDGLPSSTTYSIMQDTRGFVWIGTDAGLVRYDGTNFKTFTTDDGLPDNEVLGLIFDPQTERLWIITYSKDPSYYRYGKIYNIKNDPALAQIKCGVGEFAKANIAPGRGVFLYNNTAAYQCVNNKIEDIKIPTLSVFQMKIWNDSIIDVLYGLGILSYNKHTRSYWEVDSTPGFNRGKWIDSTLVKSHEGKVKFYEKLASGRYRQKGMVEFPKEADIEDVILSGDKYLFSVFGKRTYLCSMDTNLRSSKQEIWQGNINGIFEDKGANLWISTNDDGVYILRRSRTDNYNSVFGPGNSNITALSLAPGGKVVMGNTNGQLFLLSSKKIQKIFPKEANEYVGKIEKIRGIEMLGNNIFFMYNILVKLNIETRDYYKYDLNTAQGFKSSLRSNDGHTIFLGTINGLLECHEGNNQGNDKSKTRSADKNDIESSEFFDLGKRILSIAQHPDGRIYCGSFDGIYLFKNGKLIAVSDTQNRISRRVASMAYTPDSLLWIGTASEGIMIFDGKNIIGRINTGRYISYHGAICRKVVAGPRGQVWIATNTGVNRISYHYSDSLIIDNITPLTTADGLLSDDVNDILLKDSLLYVATAHGLSVLNVDDMSDPKQIPIYITSVRINDKDSVVHDNMYNLTYRQNNMQVQYIGISLLSGGNIRYQYRLLTDGSDKWETTTNTSIEFRSLSAGNYVFEVVVLDKFGNRSNNIARVRFHIAPAFYDTVWFWSLSFIIVLAMGFYIIRSVYRRRQIAYEKEQSYNTKIIDLEQQALKAQMNPHFIFNCLTAIQHYINKEDVYSANMYLSNFARLIRKTLDLSGEQYIMLDKEVAYLENYIQLEKMRFQDKFNYFISVAADINTNSVLIPPMLIQPIIENAIRHGLRYKDNNEGMLNIDFVRKGDMVICRIDDNGIGMKRSGELKSATHVEYQSKGMKLTESRINAINMISQMKIRMEVKDKYDETGNAIGTLVILYFEQ